MRFTILLLLCSIPAFTRVNFYPFAIEQDLLRGAPDFSFLNHSLGPADRLFVRNGHFYRVGADLTPNTDDDEPVRLFGVNLAFGANFPLEADTPRIAKRLRRLGLNLVRFHHMDSRPDRNPADAGSVLTIKPYPSLNPIAATRLRVFLNALKDEGIYANVNLHVGYTFRPSVDQVPHLDGFPNQSKPLHIFYPKMVELQTEYTSKLIGALELRGDPVLAMVEIDNESSLLRDWQTNNLDRVLAGEYRDELQRQWNTFLQGRYGSTEALRSAWGGLSRNEMIEDGSVTLPRDQDASNEPRVIDYLEFLADRDASYLTQMLRAIRASTDSLVPVAGTQMGYGGLLNLDSHANLDYNDNHFYVDHYNFPNVRWDGRDWHIRDASSLGAGLTAFGRMAAARQSGRPYTVSEFNQPWPNTHAAEIDPTLAAFAAFQDWDSIMHFAYSHGRNWDDAVPNGFNINGDWTKFPNIGQAAWLFRSGAIGAGREPVSIPVSHALRLQATREKRNGNIDAFLNAAVGFQLATVFVHPVRIEKDSRAPVPESATTRLDPPYVSDTGELTYDSRKRLFLIHSARAAGVFGFAGQEKVSAGAIDVQLGPSARGFASILLTPLDGLSVADSRHLLLSTSGYTLRTLPGSDPARPQQLVNYGNTNDWWTLEKEPAYPQKASGNLNGGIRPVWMERVESTVTVRNSADSVTVYPLDGAGSRLAPLAAANVQHIDGGFRIHLQAEGQQPSPWYEIVGH